MLIFHRAVLEIAKCLHRMHVSARPHQVSYVYATTFSHMCIVNTSP